MGFTKTTRLALLLAAAAILAYAPSCSGQSSRTIRPQDVDRILSNDRLLNTYVKCLLDKAGCSPDGKELRSE